MPGGLGPMMSRIGPMLSMAGPVLAALLPPVGVPVEMASMAGTAAEVAGTGASIGGGIDQMVDPLKPAFPTIRAPVPPIGPAPDAPPVAQTSAATGLAFNPTGSIPGASNVPGSTNVATTGSQASSDVMNQAINQALMKFGGPAASSDAMAQYSSSDFPAYG